MDSRKKSIESAFLRCAIQATDCTFTGCSAKIIAASHPPGIDSRQRMAQSRNALPTCRTTFVT